MENRSSIQRGDNLLRRQSVEDIIECGDNLAYGGPSSFTIVEIGLVNNEVQDRKRQHLLISEQLFWKPNDMTFNET